jgi:hypothetical protein
MDETPGRAFLVLMISATAILFLLGLVVLATGISALS